MSDTPEQIVAGALYAKWTTDDEAAASDILAALREAGWLLVRLDDGAGRIAVERRRQIEVEEWDAEHDGDATSGHGLALAAVCYALPEKNRRLMWPSGEIDLRHFLWPWEERWWKPTPDRIRELEKAGGLIAAEIDRLQRVPVGSGDTGGET